jgi:methyl-accepting chemotaxis protein
MTVIAGFYAQRRARMLAQLTTDLFVAAWVVLWWFVGRATARTVDAIATPARRSGDAARQLADQMEEASQQAGRVPGIGGELRKPFDGAVGSLQSIIDAADDQVAAVERAASLLGWLVFLIPVVLLLVLWLPARIRFFLRARAAQRFLDADADLDLFALRAMVGQPMHVIAAISDDPVAAWRRGDREVIRALAGIELRRSGLNPPPL